MLDKQDINVLQGMFVQMKSEIVREVRDETYSIVKAAKKEIIQEISEFIDVSIIPQLDNHESRITKLETKTAS